MSSKDSKFNARLDRIKNRTKQRAKYVYSKSDTNRRITNAKNTRENIKNAKGIKNKAKALSGGIKNTNTFFKLQNSKLARSARRAAQFISKNIVVIKWVAIILAIVFILANVGIFLYGVYEAKGSSPHYYCDLSAPKEIKDTKLYKQYCGKGSALTEVDENGVPIVPVIIQWKGVFDPETGAWTNTDWPDQALGTASTIREAGCGPTSLAMGLSYITGELQNPAELVNNSADKSFVADNGKGGTSIDIVQAFANDFGLEYKMINTIDEAVAELEAGNFVLARMGPGEVPEIGGKQWTTWYHFVLLIGIVDGNIAVADPASTENSYFSNGKVCYPPDVIDRKALNYRVLCVPDSMKN